MPKVFYLDVTRCTGCRSCEVACEREHHGRPNMFVQVIDESYAVPINCRHCEENPCIEVCPTQAIHRETPDIVSIASMKCIGCQLCTLACPFGAIWFDKLNKVARKCDRCLDRLERGEEPACVTTCSARALAYGEMHEMMALAEKRGEHAIFHRSSGEFGTLVTIPRNWNGKGE
jgi:formate dehydrogenase iron-sulfur subunit